jgi:hypothetical protein
MDYNTFVGKLKKYNCSVVKSDILYNQTDCRCWTAIINQKTDNIIVTYNINRSDLGSQHFDIISSNKISTDVEIDEVYDFIDVLINKTVLSEEPETEIQQ